MRRVEGHRSQAPCPTGPTARGLSSLVHHSEKVLRKSMRRARPRQRPHVHRPHAGRWVGVSPTGLSGAAQESGPWVGVSRGHRVLCTVELPHLNSLLSSQKSPENQSAVSRASPEPQGHVQMEPATLLPGPAQHQSTRKPGSLSVCSAWPPITPLSLQGKPLLPALPTLPPGSGEPPLVTSCQGGPAMQQHTWPCGHTAANVGQQSSAGHAVRAVVPVPDPSGRGAGPWTARSFIPPRS